MRVSFRAPVSWADLPSAVIPIVDAIMIGAAVCGVLLATALDTRWLVLTAAAILMIAGGSLLKVARAIARAGRGRGVGLGRAFIVAFVYDLGRALALVARARHRSAPSRPAAAAS